MTEGKVIATTPEPPAQPAKPVREIRQADRCDRCVAHAYVKVYIAGSSLLFCAHHYAKHEVELLIQATRVVDERWALNPSKSQPMPEGQEAKPMNNSRGGR